MTEKQEADIREDLRLAKIYSESRDSQDWLFYLEKLIEAVSLLLSEKDQDTKRTPQ